MNHPAASTWRKIFVGDTTLDIDAAANPNLDVSITNLTRQGGTETMPPFVWSNLPIRNGVFNDDRGLPGSNRHIQGQFYGPNAEEVGGMFAIDEGLDCFPACEVSGVFGAKR